MKGKKLWWIIGGAVVILLVIAVAMNKSRDTSKKVTVAKSEKVTITEKVTANGKIQPAQDVKISSDVSGEIIELAVKEGDQVTKGQLLVKINPDIYIAATNRAEASLNSARANLATANARLAQSRAQFINAEKTFNRNRQLFQSNAISQSEYDNAVSQYEVAKADVEASEQAAKAAQYSVKSAEATRKEARDNLNRTEIYAPQSGTISSLVVEEGERVVGTAQMAGTEMMRISDMSKMEVHVDVNENDIIRVSLNDTAEVEVDSYLGKKFKGLVTEIANAATSSGMGTDQVTNFAVKITLLPESYKDLLEGKPASFSPFRPGMSANVDILTATERNVIAVPIEAVTTRSDSSKFSYAKVADDSEKEEFECVFIFENGKAMIRPVTTGIQDSKFIYIKEGIELGEEIITGPYAAVSRELSHKTAVTKVNKNELFKKEEE
ncbi:efflux RND transporter periplasmic adaptor subunit [Luteibaculum oceani]|uniref:HlyD family efflux transporter periplasmic adaptor subunit n=1 Tax=Luteibaculum oceani TaxID=1294296 RepID=A0A5C6USI6_9FLAO|nr:efflux RND transporter periplasmic adaptor subunit [Luteibaculum oceani]TXC75630.1 HlyD family efflux transporter periplasmic adaptor subunit [Luteibaculum oceani]